MSDPLRPEETDGGVKLDCRECGGPPGFHQETCSYYRKGKAVYTPPTGITPTESFAHGFGGMNSDTKVNQACVPQIDTHDAKWAVTRNPNVPPWAGKSPLAPNSAGSFRKATPEEAGNAGEAAAANLSAVFPANTTIAHQWDESGERCKICGAKDWMGGLCSPKKALVQPVPVDEFQECDVCSAKPGMPQLCSGCLHNRTAIGRLSKELAEANKKLAYLHSIGLRIGMMKTSNKPEPYLAHYWTEESDEQRMFLEWTHSIGWEHRVREIQNDLDAIRMSDTPYPLVSVVEYLCQASEILLDVKDYDGIGHETLRRALVVGRAWLKANIPKI